LKAVAFFPRAFWKAVFVTLC